MKLRAFMEGFEVDCEVATSSMTGKACLVVKLPFSTATALAREFGWGENDADRRL